MIEIILGLLFVTGYVLISLEHPIRINKTATAVLLAVICWVVYMMAGTTEPEAVRDELSHHLSGIAEILFFLVGAMTIVELIDTHKGFRIVTSLIHTNSKRKLLWIISLITFFLSAALDNLTTSIVMVSLLRKLIEDRRERMVIASMVVIAANSGGAWSPIGDVTTTMLWIGGQITAINIIRELFLPAVVSLLVPLIYQSLFLKGSFTSSRPEEMFPDAQPFSRLVFFLGIGSLISVPIFKGITNLPPYMGMLMGMALLWFITELAHAKQEDRKHLRVSHILQKIDLTSILFFLGILLAVAALDSAGLLDRTALWLDQVIGNKDWIVSILGLFSAIIDNVPLVAATMGMYPLSEFPADHKIWEMIAFCAGTGGSILIIGSAAGVVVMGMEKIDFIWYLKRISFTALLGYIAGVLTYLGLYSLSI